MDIPKTVQRDIDRGIVSQGNVTSGLQFSSYVRPHSETQCNGFTSAPGHLRAFDLRPFREHYGRAVAGLVPLIESRPDDKTVLYVWRRGRYGRREPIIYGATLATPDGQIIARRVTGARYEQARAIIRALESKAGLNA